MSDAAMLGEAKVVRLPPMPPGEADRLHRIYEAVSKNIERENALINYRVCWAIWLSGGIMATEAFLVRPLIGPLSNPSWLIAGLAALCLLSTLAAWFCYRSFVGVRAAQLQMEEVKASYTKEQDAFYALGYPRPFGNLAGHLAGDANAIVYTHTLVAVWLMLAVAQGLGTASVTTFVLSSTTAGAASSK